MAIKWYPYNSTAQLSAHFNVSEFRCKCGGTHNIAVDTNLVNMLETIFTKMKCSKAIISSGYRCAKHDRTVGGYGSGPHVDGVAADVCFYDKNNKPINTKIISCIAQDMGFKGIANITWDYQWIHLDNKGRIYRGNEIYGYNTVTSDFYKYYGITAEQVRKVTGETATVQQPAQQTTTTPVNNKDKQKTIEYPLNKYDAQIKELQQVFRQKGYVIDIDGYFGPKTYEVCKKFTIEKNDRGPLTSWVQRRLNALGYNCGIADGIAGNNTMNAIASFQKAKGLGVGYLGGTDWVYLCGGTIK